MCNMLNGEGEKELFFRIYNRLVMSIGDDVENFDEVESHAKEMYNEIVLDVQGQLFLWDCAYRKALKELIAFALRFESARSTLKDVGLDIECDSELDICDHERIFSLFGISGICNDWAYNILQSEDLRDNPENVRRIVDELIAGASEFDKVLNGDDEDDE